MRDVGEGYYPESKLIPTSARMIRPIISLPKKKNKNELRVFSNGCGIVVKEIWALRVREGQSNI